MSDFPCPRAGDVAAYDRYCEETSDSPVPECAACDGTGVSIGSWPSGGKDCKVCGGSGDEPLPRELAACEDARKALERDFDAMSEALERNVNRLAASEESLSEIAQLAGQLADSQLATSLEDGRHMCMLCDKEWLGDAERHTGDCLVGATRKARDAFLNSESAKPDDVEPRDETVERLAELERLAREVVAARKNIIAGCDYYEEEAHYPAADHGETCNCGGKEFFPAFQALATFLKEMPAPTKGATKTAIKTRKP